MEPVEITVKLEVPCPAARLWAIASDAAALRLWFPLVEECGVVSGEALGRVHFTRGAWGEKRFEKHQRIVVWEPQRALAWDDVGEWLDGQLAPVYASHTRFSIELRASESGEATTVILYSYQVAADENWDRAIRARTPQATAWLEQAAANLAATALG